MKGSRGRLCASPFWDPPRAPCWGPYGLALPGSILVSSPSPPPVAQPVKQNALISVVLVKQTRVWQKAALQAGLGGEGGRWAPPRLLQHIWQGAAREQSEP